MNTATVIGRAGQDAEIRYFESGKVKTTFSLAVNRWDSKSKEETTDWFNIEVWDKQAEFAGEYIAIPDRSSIDVDCYVLSGEEEDENREKQRLYKVLHPPRKKT